MAQSTVPLHDFPQQLPPQQPPVDSLVHVSATPIELLRIAVSQNLDVERLTKLLDLQERYERNEARKAFAAAMNAFKLNPPTILKNKHVSIERKDGTKGAEYDHATLDAVCKAVIKGLSKHGISHRWKMEQEKEWIKVTCILTHTMGHAEDTTLQGCADQTGSKNAVQAMASTVTYLQRYTLLAACGLAAENDTDGRTNGNGKAKSVPADRVREGCEWLENAKDMNELRELFRVAYTEAAELNDRNAQGAYIRAKDARKAELQ